MARLLQTPREVRRLALPVAHRLIEQGEHGNRAWLIEAGQLEVIQTSDAGSRRLAVIGPGAIVGEMALIDSGVRTASVVTLSRVTCVELTRELFEAMIEANEPVARYLLQSLVAAIRRAYGFNFTERDEGGADIRSVRTNAAILDRREFSSGHRFFSQGALGTSAFLIQSGRVRIVQEVDNRIRELGTLGPGRIFGELALIQSAPRLASAIAVEQTVCEVIRKELFDSVIVSMPPILRALTKVYVAQLSQAGKSAIDKRTERHQHLDAKEHHPRPSATMRRPATSQRR